MLDCNCIFELTGNETLDFLLEAYCFDQVNELRATRMQRFDTALSEFMAPDYPTKPKPILSSLQAAFDEAVNLQGSLSTNQDGLQVYLDQLQVYLDDPSSYCEPGSPEYTYRENYLAKRSTFVWPTPEEQILMDQEKVQLVQLADQLNLTNNISSGA